MLKPVRESELFAGFFEIQGFARYLIDPEGTVRVKSNNAFLKGSMNPDGYCHYRLKMDSGHTVTIGRHRLMAAVFKHPGIDVTDLVVNHLNGIKGDDRLTNLEWTTYQGNAEHAGEMGLTEKCIPISTRDVDSGVVTDYPSYIACARDLGMTKDAIAHRVRSGEHRVFPERKQYRVKTKQGKWFIPANIDLAISQHGRSNICLAKDLISGSVVGFENQSKLAEFLGVSIAKVSILLRDPTIPVLPSLHQIKYDDGSAWREVEDPYWEIQERFQVKPVVVWNESQTFRFTSAIECAEVLKIKSTALNYRLKSCGGKVFSDGYRFAYHGDLIKTHGLNHQ